jgi:hypothetical protein
VSEEWKPVVGFEGLYDVSNMGRVRALRFRNGSSDRPLKVPKLKKVQINRHGYSRVALYRGGKPSHESVHTLVLEAFVGPKPAGQEAAHGNGVRTDNRLENLRWTTRSENHADKHMHGTTQHGERNSQSKITADDVEEIRALREQGLKLAEIGTRFGVTESNVARIVNGDTWRHV